MKYLYAALAVIVSGGLSILGHADAIWYLMWLAPIPVLLYALTHKTPAVALVAFLVGLAPGVEELIAFWDLRSPLEFIELATFVSAILSLIQILAYRWICRYFHHTAAIFVYPCIIVVTEALMAVLWPSGSTQSLAYTQVHLLPLIQIASITGYLGISFVVSLFAGAIALSIYCLKDKQAISIYAIITAGIIIIATLVYGQIRLNHDTPNRSVAVGMVGLPYNQDDVANTTPAMLDRNLTAYAHYISTLASKGAEVILLPEKAFTMTARTHDQLAEALGKLAKQFNVMLITGVKDVKHNTKRNLIWVFDRNGTYQGHYLKQHFSPNAEPGYIAGSQLKTIKTAYGTIGFAIGNDMNKQQPSHAYGEEGVGLLFVPALNAPGQTNTQYAAILRGVENGFSVAENTLWGTLTVSTQYGKVISRAGHDRAQASLLLTRAPVYQGGTFYTHTGEYMPWLCLILLALLALLAYRHKDKVESDRLHNELS